ncbi:MAG TPA: tRNA (adenosine(37)-N6)-threonylcarbamoyltransferase complex transferase subunit TsaD [Acidimicrobiia bacterium]|nr:tRNA (adenosine(37)-N6)-threonylcarbamoyltransferase complex transferase subunit TsaD [Acidimicrobiia bacterium]
MSGSLILGLETSCDETAAAVVRDGREMISSAVATQAERHAPFGGVVPEIASRVHVELVTDVVARALVEAGIDLSDVDAIAACHGPGLAGALLVGVSAAKSLALVTGRPYVGVNHHEGHMYAALLDDPTLEPPFVTLVVSGGHTLLVAMRDHGRYETLGQTVDDAAGEAFDKIARFLGLGYPGGPAIDTLSARGDPNAIPFPRPMANDGLDFSFSGLKTAVVTYCRRNPEADVADVAASFQAAVVDVLVTKLLRAAERANLDTIVIGGGVAANSGLRAEVVAAGERAGLRVVVPSIGLCTDNAAMIAACGHFRLVADGPTSLASGIDPGLRI